MYTLIKLIQCSRPDGISFRIYSIGFILPEQIETDSFMDEIHCSNFVKQNKNEKHFIELDMRNPVGINGYGKSCY